MSSPRFVAGKNMAMSDKLQVLTETSRQSQGPNAAIEESRASIILTPHTSLTFRRLLRQGRGDGLATTALTIIRSDGPVGLYRGLSSVLLFIAPKMATRFASFEWYKKTLKQGNASASSGQTMTGTAVWLCSDLFP